MPSVYKDYRAIGRHRVNASGATSISISHGAIASTVGVVRRRRSGHGSRGGRRRGVGGGAGYTAAAWNESSCLVITGGPGGEGETERGGWQEAEHSLSLGLAWRDVK